MWLEAIISKEDFGSLATELLPLSVHLGPADSEHYVLLSAPALVLGAVAITALELGATPGSPLVKGCVLVAAPLLAIANADAIVRIWRSAWAWMAVTVGVVFSGLHRLKRARRGL